MSTKALLVTTTLKVHRETLKKKKQTQKPVSLTRPCVLFSHDKSTSRNTLKNLFRLPVHVCCLVMTKVHRGKIIKKTTPVSLTRQCALFGHDKSTSRNTLKILFHLPVHVCCLVMTKVHREKVKKKQNKTTTKKHQKHPVSLTRPCVLFGHDKSTSRNT